MQGPQVQNRPWGEDAVPMRAVRNLDYVTADLFDTSATSTAVIDIASRDRSIDEIQRVINLAQGGPDFPEEGVELKQHLLEIEQRLIKGALSKAEGNVSKTARLLSLRRTTLIEKINKYGMH
tara:strand:+ start:28 stop:393 length:366 start_codon:yes stop_codon:yes gene_type:complete